jgi:hypothetical protein
MQEILMTSRMITGLMLAAACVLCSTAAVVLDNPFTNSPPAEPPDREHAAYGALPQHRESWLVFRWLIAHRDDCGTLKFLAWVPPLQVATNPFTQEPATLVRVILQSGKKDKEVEHLVFYMKDGQMLGSVREEQDRLPINGPLPVVLRPAQAQI